MKAHASTSDVGSLLVVDDSGLQRAHTVTLCRNLGVQTIHEAAGGAQALELLALLAPLPDLVIVDLEMPGMDGVELIQRLRQRGLILPVIVASGREFALIHSVETMARNLGMPVLAGLRKPLDLDQVSHALKQFGRPLEPVGAGLQRDPTTMISPAILASAIADRQIGVHYQPKVDMQTGILRGVEALARWPHAPHGFVPPVQFIALAEREGLIHDLTLSVMAQALAQAAAWNARGLRLPVAVNVAPCLLDQPALVQEFSQLVADCKLQPQQVVLEITENCLVDCTGAALTVLTSLRLKGFGLAIDDYGTGYSSMQQLGRIPFSELKIDRSLVHGAHQRSNLRVILKSTLDMAHQLGLATVAEGVETIEDWQVLQECGCATGQGYLIAKPMPPGEMPHWIRQHHSRLHQLRRNLTPPDYTS